MTKKDTAPKPEAQEAPTTVIVLGPDGPVYLTPEPIVFTGGKAEMPAALADALVNDKAAPGRYKLEG